MLSILVSCSQTSTEDDMQWFDLPLIIKNEELELSGRHEDLIRLNTEYFKKAEKMGYEAGEGLSYLNIASVNVAAGNYEKALVFFKKAKTKIEVSGNAYHKAQFYNDYSLYYFYLDQYDKAVAYNDKALEYIKEAKDSELKAKLLPRIYINRGIYYTFKKRPDTALENMHKAVALENSAYTNCMVSQFYLYNHKLDSAEVYILRAEKKMNEERTRDVESLWIYFTLGYYYNQKNMYDQAENALKKALEINIKTRRTYSAHIKNIYETLAELYKKKNDGGKAYYYLNKYMQEEEKLDEERLATINKATEDFAAEIKKESDKRKNDLRVLIIIAVCVLSVSGIYVWRVIRRLQQRKNALKGEADELKNHVQVKKQQEVIELAQTNDSSFLLKFKELYPDFIRALLNINPDLENSELAFCAMLKLGFSSKEIAGYTFVLHKSIQQKKYRIRKKLNIQKEVDIYDFFKELDGTASRKNPEDI